MEFKVNRGQALVIVILLVAIISVGIYIIFTSPLLSGTLRISTGRETGIYYQFATEYVQRVKDTGGSVEVISGAGSIETLNRLINDEVDVGFVQGGTVEGLDVSHLESLGSIYYEPVWIFHRADLNLRRLTDLAGLSVSVGEVGSGVLPLATALLTQNGISEDDATLLNLSSVDATERLRAGEIDVIFLVVSPRSNLVFELLQDDSIQVMSLERAAAYRSYFPYLTDVTIPQGALDLVNNIPAQDITLLSTTATLVVRDDTPDDYVLLLLPHIVELHRQPGILELTEEFPSTRYVELPINAAADRYYRQGPSFLTNYLSPVWASIVDRLIILAIPLITLLYPLFRGVPPVYRFGIRYSLIQWYRKLKEIDTNIHNLSLSELKERMEEVDALETDIFDEANVPNGYLDELYSLVEHIGLVYQRLEKEYERRLESQRGTNAQT